MPIHIRISRSFMEFLRSEKASGIALLIGTVFALVIANSPFRQGYLNFWHLKVGFETGGIHLMYSLEGWINDGLMAIFFLMVGLEIERELYIGELSTRRTALLPVLAALGGMLIPALIYILFTHNYETRAGFGIPMATDIAFSLSALLLLGRRLPPALRVFLTAFAIVDDLGAILIIAIFYSSSFSLLYLALGLAIFLLLVALNRLGVQNLAFYLIPGFFMWYFIHLSGIHAVIAGVLLAFAIPFRRGVKTSPSTRLQHFLHKPVALIVMPLFALANTGVVLERESFNGLVAPHSLGIYMGLLIGKPLGIVLFSYLAVKAGLCDLPDRITFRHLTGAGFLGGIGFTMSIFVTFLAFGGTDLEESSKIAIMLASLSAAGVGLFLLSRRPMATPEEEAEEP